MRALALRTRRANIRPGRYRSGEADCGSVEPLRDGQWIGHLTRYSNDRSGMARRNSSFSAIV